MRTEYCDYVLAALRARYCDCCATSLWHQVFPVLCIVYCVPQRGVTPINSIVTAATVGQNFDRLFRQFDR